MIGADEAQPGRLRVWQRALLIACVAAVYAINFWPATQLRNAGLAALGDPDYVGFRGIFLPHVFLYSTLTAVGAAIAWLVFIKAGMLPWPQLAWPTRIQVSLGAVGGVVALVASLAFAYFLLPGGTVHWIDPVPWKIAGNIFSNFYEEFIFRGFMLTALAAAIGFWPAAIVSSAMWGFTHTQYPLSLQALIAAIGIYWSFLVRRARSLWTPYSAHMVLDIIGDSLIG